MSWLTSVMFAQLALAAGALVGMLVDPRQLLGVSVWLKPFKFAVSVFIYLFTLRAILRLQSRELRWPERVARIVAVAMAFEMALLNLQAARGVTSHFNESTAFNATVFNVMGLLILVNTTAAAFTGWKFWKPQQAQIGPGTLWGIRWGMLLFILGSVQAVAMLAIHAHTVGAPDGGPGLPLLNWSTTHGDLRAAHAMGLHGMQVLPIAGWLADRYGAPNRPMLVSGVAILYGGLFAFLLMHALAGRPVTG
ncbi:MAG: hypothetical protein U0Q16_03690 [Bryobacteraceae bacterium]